MARDPDEATDFIERVMEKNELGEGGKRVMLEQALEGEELSFILLTDGERYAPLVPTRDHKRAFDNNEGPNTGGMGAYSTDELLPPELRRVIETTIVEPTHEGFGGGRDSLSGISVYRADADEKRPEGAGVQLPAGRSGNAGDCGAVDFDLAEVLADMAAGRLKPETLKWKAGASACVVAASGGYPGKFETGKEIFGLNDAGMLADVKVLHAGTKRVGEKIVTSGGRVLGVTATGKSLPEALKKAYAGGERFNLTECITARTSENASAEFSGGRLNDGKSDCMYFAHQRNARRWRSWQKRWRWRILGLKAARTRGRESGEVLLMDEETLRSFGLAPGIVRENVTTEGLEVNGLRVGQKLKIGEVELEVSLVCDPCEQIEALREGLQEAMEGKRGMLCRVLRGGLLRRGDAIELMNG